MKAFGIPKRFSVSDSPTDIVHPKQSVATGFNSLGIIISLADETATLADVVFTDQDDEVLFTLYVDDLNSREVDIPMEFVRGCKVSSTLLGAGDDSLFVTFFFDDRCFKL